METLTLTAASESREEIIYALEYMLEKLKSGYREVFATTDELEAHCVIKNN